MRRAPLLFVWILAGCTADPGGELLVDFVTDILPLKEFDTIVLEVDAEEMERFGDVEERDFFAGTRLTMPALDTGAGERIVAIALRRDGEEVLRRTARVLVEGVTGVTFAMQRSCLVADCPVECIDGVCVDPLVDGCMTGVEESCPPELLDRGCETDTSCTPEFACVEGRCAQGLCLEVPRDQLCDENYSCSDQTGCFYSGPHRPWFQHLRSDSGDQWVWGGAVTDLGPCLAFNTSAGVTFDGRTEPALAGGNNLHAFCFEREGALRWWTPLTSAGGGFQTRSMDCTLDGRCAVGGYVQGGAPELPDGTVLASTNSQDGAVLQFDVDGAVTALTRLDAAGNQQVHDVRYSPDGRSLSAQLNSFRGAMTLDDGSMIPGASSDDASSFMVDLTGSSSRAHTPADTGAARANGIGTGDDGSRVAISDLRTSADIDGDGTPEASGPGAYLTLVDATGALADWFRLGGSGSPIPLATDDGWILVGTVNGALSFGEELVLETSSPDIFVVRLDTSLTVTDFSIFGGPGNDAVRWAHLDADGNVVITGTTAGDWERGPSESGAFVLQLDASDGLRRWLNVPGSFEWAYGGIADGVAYLVGEASGTVSFAGQDHALMGSEVYALGTDQFEE